MAYPSDEVQKKFYDGDTEKRHRNGRLIQIEQYLIKFLRDNKDIKTVLEVGCGVGLTSQFFLTMGLDVTGVDISEKHIEKCKRIAPRGHFYAMNFINLDLEEGKTFDFISFFDILEHIPKPHHVQVFQQIKKFSHPKTKIGIIIPEPKNLDSIRSKNPETLQPVDESIYPSDIDPLIEEFRLEKIEETTYGEYTRYVLQYKHEDINSDSDIK